MNLLVVLSILASAMGWGTLYSYTDGRIYLHLSNDDLVGLNFSITGFGKLSSSASFNLESGQNVETLPSPPSNSTLFLIGKELYGFTAGNSHSKDLCGGGSMSLIKFDHELNSWNQNSGDLDFSGISDASFFQSSTVLTNPSNNHTVYIYGGECSMNGDVSNRMISLDILSLKVSNISTSTRPQPFYGAANILAPNSQSQLVIGGQSSLGWLNMYQLATWDFNSGWSFKQIKDSSDGNGKVNSRKFPLVLPIFNKLDNSSISSIENQLEVNEVLLIGGKLLNSAPTPSFSKLILDSNDWAWNSSFDTNIDVQEILGAATIFNTLIVVNSSSASAKRDRTQYSINLYDIQSFSPVDNLKKNVQLIYSGENNSSGHKASIQKKEILGTVLPLCALLFGFVGGLFLYNRRKRKQQLKLDEVSEIDYHFGSYNDNASTRTNLYHVIPPPPNRAHTKLGQTSEDPSNETNSTLDVASFDSWIKKREKFDQEKIKINRYSYLGSNETLSGDVNFEPQKQAKKLCTIKPQPTSMQYSTNLVNRSVSIIKKSFSFTNTPPIFPGGGGYGTLANKNIATRNLPRPARTIDDEDDRNIYADPTRTNEPPGTSNSPFDEATTDNEEDEQVSDSDFSVDDKMDVQVLVSSKRRSVLKVVNPDLRTIEDVSETENPFDLEEDKTNIRQRIPSGAKLLDE